MKKQVDVGKGITFVRSTDSGTSVRTLDNEHLTLTEALEEFEYFLRGCGYYFDGSIQMVERDE